jgi:L-threonylcarbamoyladenylate synthase
MTGGADIAHAVSLLRAGELVAFPTETVYGLGADARNAAAIGRIYALKRRPSGHPLIVHLAAASALPAWARAVPAAADRLARRFWPGPLTLILPRAAGVADALTGGQDSIGLRVPAHPLAQALLASFGGGIAAPSANRYGRVSPTSAAHVREEFGGETPFVLDGGECAVGLESTIVSFLGEPLLVRPGGISLPEIEAVIGPLRRAALGEGPRAPGTTRAHYAPATPLAIVAPAALEAAAGPRSAVLARRARPAGYAGALWLDGGDDPARYAHDLYANLRRLDHAAADAIVVEAVPADDRWEAVRDRLRRAAAACGAEDSA